MRVPTPTTTMAAVPTQAVRPYLTPGKLLFLGIESFLHLEHLPPLLQ